MIDLLKSQIEKRRVSDEAMFQDAFADLLSVLGIDRHKAVRETKSAIAQILRHLGKEVPDVPESITDLDSQLEYMIRPSGTMRRRIELLGKWWKDAAGCILTSTKDGDVIAILPNKISGYEYKDKNGKLVRINEQTAKNINIDGFCFYKPFPLTKLKIRDLVLFMAQTLTIMDLVLILGVMALLQGLALIQPPITRILYNTIAPSQSVNLLIPLGVFLFGVSFGSWLIKISESIIFSRLQNRLYLNVNSAVMMRLFSLPTTFFKNYTSGDLANRMSQIASLCQMIASAVLSTGLRTIFSLTFLFQMANFAPTLVIPGMIALFAEIIFIAIITFMKQSIYKKQLELSPKMQTLVYALFGGIQKIKIAGAEKRAFSKWAEKHSEIEKLNYSPPFVLKINSVIHLVISSLGTIAIYYFAGINHITLADYVAFNSAYGAVAGAIMGLSGIALEMATLKPVLDMIKPVMEQEPENTAGRRIPIALTGDIDVSNVKFRYEKDGPLILDNITLRIKKGEYLGIVGKTGCGKSTLLRILLGFETPEQGAVYYGGKDLASLDLRTVRQKIGVVMQNGTLFPGDIFSNIIVTSPWKTLDDAWEAAEMAGIKQDIKDMPMGMHTLVTEGSGGLSGGQKQRIMIARAIISKPSILYFDEATSALDNITQNHVAESISGLNCTRVVIAHRLSTIKNCDRIIVLDEGKIAEEGTYDALMEKKGMFYSLAIRQIAN